MSLRSQTPSVQADPPAAISLSVQPDATENPMALYQSRNVTTASSVVPDDSQPEATKPAIVIPGRPRKRTQPLLYLVDYVLEAWVSE